MGFLPTEKVGYPVEWSSHASFSGLHIKSRSNTLAIINEAIIRSVSAGTSSGHGRVICAIANWPIWPTYYYYLHAILSVPFPTHHRAKNTVYHVLEHSKHTTCV